MGGASHEGRYPDYFHQKERDDDVGDDVGGLVGDSFYLYIIEMSCEVYFLNPSQRASPAFSIISILISISLSSNRLHKQL